MSEFSISSLRGEEIILQEDSVICKRDVGFRITVECPSEFVPCSFLAVCCCCLVAKSHPTLCAPWTVALQAPLSLGVLRQCLHLLCAPVSICKMGMLVIIAVHLPRKFGMRFKSKVCGTMLDPCVHGSRGRRAPRLVPSCGSQQGWVAFPPGAVTALHFQPGSWRGGNCSG